MLTSAWIHYFHTCAVVMRVLHKMKMATTAQVQIFLEYQTSLAALYIFDYRYR